MRLNENEIALLAGVENLPSAEDVEAEKNSPAVKAIHHKCIGNNEELQMELHQLAKFLLSEGKTDEAWRVLMAG